MNIVVLDGYTLNPGDLSWKSLQALGYCEIYNRTSPESVVQIAENADIVLTNKTVLDADIIAQLPKLQYIGVLATGYNVVDVAAAQKRNIIVTNVPAYGVSSVAQMVFALLLELTHQVGHHAHGVHAGRWSSQPDFCYWDMPMIDLANKTMGIVGYGAIGQQVAKIAEAFNMSVLVHTPHPPENVKNVDLNTLLQESHVVSLHCPLNSKTQNLINADSLKIMNSAAILINTSRGGLVDEHALAHALYRNEIAGAGLDVLSKEPPDAENPLFTAPNCFITPHIAWATFASRQNLLQEVVKNIQAFLRGEARNVIKNVN